MVNVPAYVNAAYLSTFRENLKKNPTKSQIIFDSLKISLPDTCIIIIIVSEFHCIAKKKI